MEMKKSPCLPALPKLFISYRWDLPTASEGSFAIAWKIRLFLTILSLMVLSHTILAQCTTEVCNGVDDDCDGFVDEYVFSSTNVPVSIVSTASSVVNSRTIFGSTGD